MRKLGLSLLAISVILLMVSPSFAQTPRQPISTDGKSGFTNIAVRGFDGYLTPAYIEMTNGVGDIYYLYVGTQGMLRIASEASVGTNASPALTAWEDASGQVVGNQAL